MAQRRNAVTDELRKRDEALEEITTRLGITAERGKRFADLTAETRPSTPQELATMLDQEEKLVVPLIKKLGIKAE